MGKIDIFTIVLELLREPAMDFPAASAIQLLKATRTARRRTVSVKRLERQKLQVALMAAPPADLLRRPVVRALANFDRQLKWVSASH